MYVFKGKYRQIRKKKTLVDLSVTPNNVFIPQKEEYKYKNMKEKQRHLNS